MRSVRFFSQSRVEVLDLIQPFVPAGCVEKSTNASCTLDTTPSVCAWAGLPACDSSRRAQQSRIEDRRRRRERPATVLDGEHGVVGLIGQARLLDPNAPKGWSLPGHSRDAGSSQRAFLMSSIR
jgi:hypothetical protein